MEINSLHQRKFFGIKLERVVYDSYIKAKDDNLIYLFNLVHCVKSVRIQSYSGPYSVQMRENTDQNNSEYGHFSRSGYVPDYQCSCRKEIKEGLS